MFTEPTVFVLGAGASWHYGYPTGEGLIECVISMADRLAQYCNNRVASGQVIQVVPEYVEQRMDRSRGMSGAVPAWKQVRDECLTLIDRLSAVRPLVIDYFLAWNESLRPIGKLMIAAVILECEAIWLKERANQNRRLSLANNPIRPHDDEIRRLDIGKYHDDWYRFVVHKLVYGCNKSADLLENKVRFVTFNYDTSLEYHLYRALSAIDFLEAPHVSAFLNADRIVHVYGSVRSGITTEADFVNMDVVMNLGSGFRGAGVPDFATEFEPRKAFLDRCAQAAENLRTIDGDDKVTNEPQLQQARQWIASNRHVYVLGYGFDPNNSSRIGLAPSENGMEQNRRIAMYTNYLEIGNVTKRANRIFVGWGRAEPSFRNVYEALEKDFDGLTSEQIPEKRR